MRKHISNVENRRTKQPKVQTRWIREGDVRKCAWRKDENEERKGTTKIEPKKQNDNVISNWVDEGKNSNDGILKGMTEFLTNITKEMFFERRALGDKKGPNSVSNCRTQFLCITYSMARHKKKHQNCKETALLVIIWKRNTRHKINKMKTKKKKTQMMNPKKSTTEKPEGPKWKELGFQKGMWEKCV